MSDTTPIEWLTGSVHVDWDKCNVTVDGVKITSLRKLQALLLSIDSIAAELHIALDALDIVSDESVLQDPKLDRAIARNTASGIRERLLADGVLGFK